MNIMSCQRAHQNYYHIQPNQTKTWNYITCDYSALVGLALDFVD